MTETVSKTADTEFADAGLGDLQRKNPLYRKMAELRQHLSLRLSPVEPTSARPTATKFREMFSEPVFDRAIEVDFQCGQASSAGLCRARGIRPAWTAEISGGAG